MKKGISLIVLVITIIVMIIIAGAIIISLNSTNVINRANEATEASDLANAKNAVMLAYAELAAGNNGIASLPNPAPEGVTTLQGYYEKVLADAGFTMSKYTITVDATTGIPTLEAVKPTGK